MGEGVVFIGLSSVRLMLGSFGLASAHIPIILCLALVLVQLNNLNPGRLKRYGQDPLSLKQPEIPQTILRSGPTPQTK